MNENTIMPTQSQQAKPASEIATVSSPLDNYWEKEPRWRLPIQLKLSVGAVDDPLEHEADAVADKVMRMPAQSFIQRKCNHCEEEENDGIAQLKPLVPFIQKKENTNNGGTVSDAISNQINSTKGGGNRMDSQTQSFMESRFGTSFQAVKIHTGNYASELSQQLNAQAFTVGNDVYFNQNKYTPNTNEGKYLLAHELTHTVQQNGNFNQAIRRQAPPASPLTKDATIPPIRSADENATETKPTEPLGNSTEGSKISKDATPPLPPGAMAVGAINFAKATDCNISIPSAPQVPTPLPFVADKKATLPAKETAPDLSILHSDKPFWDDAGAKAIAQAIADCYASRTASSTKKIDASAKFIELQSDFNDVVQGSFGRSSFDTWWHLPQVLEGLLTKYRDGLVTFFKERNAKAKSTQTPAEMDAEVELEMQQKRHNLVEEVRTQVALGIWGWEAERREKLDFETLKPGENWISAPDPLTDDETNVVIHNVLVKHNRLLSDKEVADTNDTAQKESDKAAKKAGTPAKPLTDAEKQHAQAKAEYKVITSKGWDKELKGELATARNTKEKSELVMPTMPEWSVDDESTAVGKRIKEIIILWTKEIKLDLPKPKQGKGSKPLPPPTDAEKEEMVAKKRVDNIVNYANNWNTRIKKGNRNFKDNAIFKTNTDLIDSLKAAPSAQLALSIQMPAYIVALTARQKEIHDAAEGNWTHKGVEAVLITLKTEFPAGFSAGNYKGHGGGNFAGRLFSADMYPKEKVSRNSPPFGNIGFFDQQTAYEFALAIDRSVGAHSGKFQILYNDFAVAREVNKVMKNGKMMNTDNANTELDTPKTKDNPNPSHHGVNLNWHGPLVTHFHVDFNVK